MKTLSLVLLLFLTGCGFDEGCVGRKNSNAFKDAKHYWSIKEKTVIPLQEIIMGSNITVIYSLDGENLLEFEMRDYQKGFEFHKLNYSKEETRIQNIYKQLLERKNVPVQQ